jgi:hypothetical protein
MQQSVAWQGLYPEVRLRVPEHRQGDHQRPSAQTSAVDVNTAVSAPELLRSRTRTRRRRRKRGWGAPWASLRSVDIDDYSLRTCYVSG